MKLLFTLLFGICCSTLAHATSVEELSDAIDEIESKIDNIDLDQSTSDIQSDLDDIKQALEDLKGEDAVYVNPNSPKANYTLVPVTPKTKIVGGHKYVWTQSDNPKIGWHWLQVN